MGSQLETPLKVYSFIFLFLVGVGRVVALVGFSLRSRPWASSPPAFSGLSAHTCFGLIGRARCRFEKFSARFNETRAHSPKASQLRTRVLVGF